MKFHRTPIARAVLCLPMWAVALLLACGLLTVTLLSLRTTTAVATTSSPVSQRPRVAPASVAAHLQSQADQATFYISNEEASSRALVDSQDDLWRAAVQTAQSCNNFQTGILSETVSTLCGSQTGACINPNLFATGLTISYTLRNMRAGQLLGSADAWGSGRGAGCSGGTTLQDGSPRPTGIGGCYYNDAANFRGDTQSPNAVLFTFNQPQAAFGAWFGDLESKPFGTTYYRSGRDGGTGSGGALAYVRLIFEDGTLQEMPITPTVAPISTWLSSTAPVIAPLGSGGNVGLCGGSDSSDPKGCGNETTRWIGFITDNPRNRVKQMLVVVGDDDHSGAGPSSGPNVQCSGGAANTCNAGTEYLSFIGPTVCLVPDLALAKFDQPDPVLAGSIVTYTLRYHHLLAGVASGVITISDMLPPGVTYLTTVASNPPATLANANPQWQVASLPANTTGYITFTVQVGANGSGAITNSATLATLGDLDPSNNQTQASTQVLQAGLVLRKLTNGVLAQMPPGAIVNAGDAITWSYQITNTGTVTLTNLQLVDDRIPTLACTEGSLPAQLPPQATFTCTIHGQAQVGQYGNQATVTATPTLSGSRPISATALAHYFGLALGRVVVTKVVVNDHGGQATAADFPLALNGNAISSGVTVTLAAGVYTVTESNDRGYISSFSGDCTATGVINLTPGALQRCTLTNNDPPPTLGVLTVQKVVINDNGGTAQVNDFPLWVNQQMVQTGVENLLAPGQYTVAESNQPGYQATFGGDCAADGTITLAAGEQKVCTLTNDDIAPTLTVHKIVVNNHGGAAQVGDFPLWVDGSPVTSGVTQTLAAGEHQVGEQSLPGYGATFSGDCAADGSITLALGEQKVCTITNDDLPPPLATLTVQKVVVNDHGGARQVSDFPLYVNGQPVLSGVEQLLPPGSYQITETATAGYAANFSGDCAADGSISLNANERKVCTITNDDIAPTLTVHKVVINDNTGTASAADFPLWVNLKLVGNGAVNLLAAGTYTVSESNRPGYAATFSGDCASNGQITLGIGETKSCTITNDDLPPALGLLTVQKIVINDHGGSSTAADFALTVNGQAVVNGADNLLAPGAYTVSEVNQPGYAATFGGDCTVDGQVTLAAGEHKTCILTNDDIAPTLTLHKRVINDHGGLVSALDFPLFVDDLRVAPDSPTTLRAGYYTVHENDLLGYVGQISGDCAPDGRIELHIGDAKECTLTNDDLPPSLGLLTVHKVVINESGGMAQVSDFALAVNGQPVVSGVETALPPGAYTVSESNLPGYQASFSGDCSPDGVVAVVAHQSRVCTITNDDRAPQLMVEKVVINDDGGGATVADFPLMVGRQVVRNGVTTTLAAGDHLISERNLPGYQATFSGDCSTTGQVTLALGETKHCTITNNDYFASLGDRVWYDRDLDGQQGADEPGISGVTVQLYDTAGNLVTTTVTGGTGDYLFSGLLPGAYVVAFHKAADFVFTQPDQGDERADSDVNPDSGRTSVIPLGPSTHQRAIDAGLYQLAALGNVVWHDLNANGIQDPHEPGLGGIWVTLYDANHTIVGITQSNAQGFYGFTDLPPGAYSLRFDLAFDYRFTQRDQGDDTFDSDVDPSSGETGIFVLGPNDTNLTAKAGVLAYPRLALAKTVNHSQIFLTSTATALLTYTLTYSNGGLAPATGVVITETVPPLTTFVAAASSAGWHCPAGPGPGSTCLFAVGTVPPQRQGQVVFALALAEGIDESLVVDNQARLGDDNNHTALGMPQRQPAASVQTVVNAPTSLGEATEPAPIRGQLYLPWVERGEP